MLRCSDDKNFDDSKLCPGSREVFAYVCLRESVYVFVLCVCPTLIVIQLLQTMRYLGLHPADVESGKVSWNCAVFTFHDKVATTHAYVSFSLKCSLLPAESYLTFFPEPCSVLCGLWSGSLRLGLYMSSEARSEACTCSQGREGKRN